MSSDPKWTNTPSRIGSWAKRIYVYGDWRIEPTVFLLDSLRFAKCWRVSHLDVTKARCTTLKVAKKFVESQVD